MKTISEQILSFAESELLEKESIRRAVLSEAPAKQKKPVAWTKILLPIAACLVLAVGTVFLIPSARAEVVQWFSSIFTGASEQIDQERKEQSERFETVRESLKGLPLELAGDLEMWMDFQEDSARAIQTMLREAAKNAVPVQTESDGVVLAEFSIYDVSGMESSAAKHLFFGFVGTSETNFSDSAVILIDGVEKSAYRLDVPFPDSTENRYAIYDCVPDLDDAYLPETSLVAIRLNSASFCFRLRWTDRSVVLPRDAAEHEAWFAESARLAEAAHHLSCVSLTGPVVHDGFTVAITDLSLENNDLIIDADVEASPTLSDMHAQVTDITLHMRDRTYTIGVSLSVVRLEPDDFDFSASLTHHTRWRITLPVPASELSGETFDFSFCIHAVKQTDRDPDDDGLRTEPFRFSFRIGA